MKIRIEKIEASEYEVVNDIWESAVRATHHFLSEADIESIRPFVIMGLEHVETVVTARDEAVTLWAFMGIDQDKIEMLFVHHGWRGHGIGKQFIQLAIESLDIRYVDVNEQNVQGVGFYQRMGFKMIERTETDDEGRPFPILKLKLKG